MDCSLADAIARFLDHCRIAKRLSANTLRAYQTDLGDFSRFMRGGQPVVEIDRECLRRYARKLFDVDCLKEASAKRRMASLKVMFRWLERDEVIALSPFHRLDLSIRLPRRLPRNLAAGEMRTLLRACDGQPGHASMLLRFIIICLFSTGLRVGELANVSVDDLDSNDSSILVRGKGNRERRVFLPKGEAASTLRQYLKSRCSLRPRSEKLLVTSTGSPVDTQHIRRLVVRLAEQAGLNRRVTPHMLRHTAATQLIEAGVDIRFVQKLLGHASIATTQIYTQVSDMSLKATLERADTLGRVKGERRWSTGVD
ncbi:tyrosine-type recombinase/integrase [Niveispirillum sp. KHB5.9]|uniref:tyrosine-type recombinase/integrase n=1 Tax=Niveispirillum sp. KHB5.9 TaxID=3400269 RepID=UPI003A8B4B1D